MKKETQKIEKKKKKIRIKTKDFLRPFPREEYFSVKELYTMLEDKFKGEEHKSIEKSLKEHGYAPEKEEFDYIKIKAYFDMGYKIVDGRKRIAVLGKNKNNNTKLKVINTIPLYKKDTNINIRNFNKSFDEFRKKNNTEISK
tara:strand:- start:214 stop:639 length:426 start_codon:yes stop_codon:yes gene_type:complete